jgi:hypothetical protein
MLRSYKLPNNKIPRSGSARVKLLRSHAATNGPTSQGRTILAGSDPQFVWAAIAYVYGIPGVPEWADWFTGELRRHRALTPALGIGCAPVRLLTARLLTGRRATTAEKIAETSSLSQTAHAGSGSVASDFARGRASSVVRKRAQGSGAQPIHHQHLRAHFA